VVSPYELASIKKSKLLIMNNIGFLVAAVALGIYNFMLPPIKKTVPIQPRNEELNNRPAHFMMGNKYSPKFNKK